MVDIPETITAIHSREERYEKLEILFYNDVQKTQILRAIDELSWRPECQVEIATVDEGEGRGFVAVEFHDDYDKEAGLFFDALIRKLGIDRC